MFNIELFNFWHLFILFMTVVFGFIAYFVFRNKSQKTKEVFMKTLAFLNLAIYIFRMARNWNEEWYNAWEDLPFHLCGMTTFFFILAMYIKHPLLKNFCYFVLTPGGIMALLIPTNHFLGTPVYTLTNISFYGEHMLIVLFGILLVSLGLTKPKFKSALYSVALLAGLCVICHGINLGITALGLGKPNYMFTVDASTNALLSMIYNIFPVKLAYLLLFAPTLVFFCAIFYLPVFISRKKQGSYN